MKHFNILTIIKQYFSTKKQPTTFKKQYMHFLKLITPTNLASEKAKFFASNNYHPIFEYDWNREKINQWLEKRPKFAPIAQAIINQDNRAISILAKHMFNTDITEELLKKAKNYLQIKPEILPTRTIEQVENAFNQGFQKAGLTEYRANVVDQYGFNARPNYTTKTVKISKYINLDFFSLDGIVRHEITHVIRYENAATNNIPKSENYLPTEEGLATYFHDFGSELGELSMFQHASEYVITDIALSRSLREMIEFLIEIGSSKENAWKRAVRHKFGFIDTRQAGDIMKPSMYFFHQQKIANLTDDERLRLLVGKIPLDDLRHYPTYFGRIPLQTLKEFYRIR